MYSEGHGVSQDYAEAIKWLRLSADQGNPAAQTNLGVIYADGRGVTQDFKEAIKWYQAAAAQGYAVAQYNLGYSYEKGEGVEDPREAVRWYQMAAEQGDASAQYSLGTMYETGRGVRQDFKAALELYRRAADSVAEAAAAARNSLGAMFERGHGVAPDRVQAHAWYNLAAALGNEDASKNRDRVAQGMTPDEIESAHELARNWQPNANASSASGRSRGSGLTRSVAPPEAARITKTGSGFFVSNIGHILTNNHVIEGCGRLTLTGEGTLEVVSRDATNDLALLRWQKKADSAAVFASAAPRLGESVTTFGYPLPGLLSSAGSVTTGTISATAGPQDDSRLLQITAPVQPGNSGGPLLDSSGAIVGVVVSMLDALAIAKATGDVPQNVNFAIKTAIVRVFLDSNHVVYRVVPSTQRLDVPEIAARARQFTVRIECWQ